MLAAIFLFLGVAHFVHIFGLRLLVRLVWVGLSHKYLEFIVGRWRRPHGLALHLLSCAHVCFFVFFFACLAFLALGAGALLCQ